MTVRRQREKNWVGGVGGELVHIPRFSFRLLWFGFGLGVWFLGVEPWKSLGVDRRAGKTRI